MALNSDASYFTCKLPLETMSSYMNVKELRDVSSIHCIPYRKTDSKDTHIQNFIGHYCPSCDDYTFVFTPFTENKKLETKKMALRKRRKEKVDAMDTSPDHIITSTSDNNMEPVIFPPKPPSKSLIHSIITDFCNETQPTSIMECGCAVCGQLFPLSNLCELKNTSCDLNILLVEHIGRKERKSITEPILPLSGQVLDMTCKHICAGCETIDDRKSTDKCLS